MAQRLSIFLALVDIFGLSFGSSLAFLAFVGRAFSELLGVLDLGFMILIYLSINNYKLIVSQSFFVLQRFHNFF